MPQAIISIIASLMKLAAIFIGDYYLKKWISAGRVWWRSIADPVWKIECDQEYDRLAAAWDQYQNDRGPIRPAP